MLILMWSLNASLAWPAAICAKWHGQPATHNSGFLLINLDVTEFLLLIITFVLSTLRLTQLFHSIFSDSKHCSIAAKITDALAASLPSVRHIETVVGDLVRTLDVKYTYTSRFHFFNTLIIWAIMTHTIGISFAMFSQVAVTIRMKCFIYHCTCFLFSTGIRFHNFAIRKNRFE